LVRSIAVRAAFAKVGIVSGVLEVTAMVEPFENGRGFSLRVPRAGKPLQK